MPIIFAHPYCATNKACIRKLRSVTEKLSKPTDNLLSYKSAFEFAQDIKAAVKGNENVMSLFLAALKSLRGNVYSAALPHYRSSDGLIMKEASLLWCICLQPRTTITAHKGVGNDGEEEDNLMISCDFCDYLYHPICLGYTKCSSHEKCFLKKSISSDDGKTLLSHILYIYIK
jgi:hypothetical protein